MKAKHLKSAAKAVALIALSCTAAAFGYDSFIRAPAARAEAASVLDPVATSNTHCSGLGFSRLAMIGSPKLSNPLN